MGLRRKDATTPSYTYAIYPPVGAKETHLIVLSRMFLSHPQGDKNLLFGSTAFLWGDLVTHERANSRADTQCVQEIS